MRRGDRRAAAAVTVLGGVRPVLATGGVLRPWIYCRSHMRDGIDEPHGSIDGRRVTTSCAMAVAQGETPVGRGSARTGTCVVRLPATRRFAARPAVMGAGHHRRHRARPQGTVCGSRASRARGMVAAGSRVSSSDVLGRGARCAPPLAAGATHCFRGPVGSKACWTIQVCRFATCVAVVSPGRTYRYLG
jgi:hypothetical protein